MRINFVGSSYVFPSASFDTQRSINCYPDKSETQTSKDAYILAPTPGKKLYLTLPVSPIRGFYTTSNGRAFAVAYNTLYEIFSDSTYTPRGTISTYTGNISMADNGFELIVVDGSVDGWILNLGTGVFAQIDTGGAGAGFLGATTVCFLAGYFICNQPDSGVYFWSASYDGLTWDAADFANAEGSPDNLTALVTLHQQVALLGANTTQFIYNAGTSPDPFQNIQGVFMEYGCNSPFSVQQCYNTIFWIGSDKSGQDMVWMANGYNPQKISTVAIEHYLDQYDTTTATSYSYQEDGHYFYAINLDGAPTTLVYDITLEQWHERAFWNISLGDWQRDKAQFHVVAFGNHLVSDSQNGNIYQQSASINDDNGDLIRRQRTFPYVKDDLEYLFFKTLQIDMQVGVGLGSGNNQNTDPQAMLEWSDDAGNTWSNEYWSPIGKVGEYLTRVIWRRLGRGRYRVFRVTIDANIPVWMIAAYLDVEKGIA